MPDERSLGQLCHDSLVYAARLKTDALRARKLADRILDRILLTTDGKSIPEREARARTHMEYITADDAAIEAESAAIVARAKADGLQVRFEEFRTNAATTRAEMTLR